MKFDKIIGVYNKDNHKIFNFFGLKIKVKHFAKKEIEHIAKIENSYKEKNRFTDEALIPFANHIRNISIAQSLHKETFGEYKNKYQGKDVVLIATGPTLNYFRPIKDAVYIGVNKAICNKTVDLDYLFIIDYAGATKDYIEEGVKHPKTTKFYGYFNIIHCSQMMIPESIRIRHKAKGFVACPYWNDDIDIRYGYEPDISRYPLHCYRSVIMSALQFALFTNPKRIYLVGCDCTSTGHFDSKKTSPFNEFAFQGIKEEWNKMKNIIDFYYPETEIISINPVGLKGMFKDEYTDEFVNHLK